MHRAFHKRTNHARIGSLRIVISGWKSLMFNTHKKMRASRRFALFRNGNAPRIIVRSARKYLAPEIRFTRSSNGGADPFYREKWTGTIGNNATTIIWARKNRTWAKLEWLFAASPTIAIVRRMPMQRFIACHKIVPSSIRKEITIGVYREISNYHGDIAFINYLHDNYQFHEKHLLKS